MHRRSTAPCQTTDRTALLLFLEPLTLPSSTLVASRCFKTRLLSPLLRRLDRSLSAPLSLYPPIVQSPPIRSQSTLLP